MKPERANKLNLIDYVMRPIKGCTTKTKWRVAYYLDNLYVDHEYYKDRKQAVAAADKWYNENEGRTARVDKLTKTISW